MTTDKVPKAAIEAGARAAHGLEGSCAFDEWDAMEDEERDWFRELGRETTTAAYPHIRRAVIEELIAKAETRSVFYIIESFLRAELEGGDRG